jgi:hypothetical protein
MSRVFRCMRAVIRNKWCTRYTHTYTPTHTMQLYYCSNKNKTRTTNHALTLPLCFSSSSLRCVLSALRDLKGFVIGKDRQGVCGSAGSVPLCPLSPRHTNSAEAQFPPPPRIPSISTLPTLNITKHAPRSLATIHLFAIPALPRQHSHAFTNLFHAWQLPSNPNHQIQNQ